MIICSTFALRLPTVGKEQAGEILPPLSPLARGHFSLLSWVEKQLVERCGQI